MRQLLLTLCVFPALVFGQTTYETVGIIGDATANGWDVSTPLTQDENDPHLWSLDALELTPGEVKFRANNDWEVNWGATDFPSGTGTQDGPNIPVPAGAYDITFNDTNGEYDFTRVGEGGEGGGEERVLITVAPEFPGLDEEVTITYDATQGTSGLAGADKVYMHSGTVMSEPTGTTWTNVVGNWGQDDGVGEMTPVPDEENQWQITLPSIREYYGVAAGQPVFRLGIVFRNAAGTQTGKSDTDGDIFVDVDPGNYVRWTSPVADLVFATVEETVSLQAEAPAEASSLELSVKEAGEEEFEAVASATNATAVTYEYPVQETGSIEVKVVATIDDEVIESVRQIQIAVRPATPVAELPEGLVQGINYDTADLTTATLVLLAPKKDFVYAVGDFTDWQINDNYLMKQTPDGEFFWLTLNELTPEQAYVFQYWVDGTIKVGDPYAAQVADPFNDGAISEELYPGLPDYNRTDDGIATVLQTGRSEYTWQNRSVVGGRPANEDLVIYELLVRDFLTSHSYDDLADTLSYLKRLGVNAIELMPIMEFEGNESWGYNPSYALAADKYYGTPTDLKAFIDRAHGEGMVVLLDMVLNHHFGQSPMVRMYWDEARQRPAENSPWFNPVATHPFNVGFDFNHESEYTQNYMDDVNRYWLEEFAFDGFRFDLSKGFTQNEGKDPEDVGAWSEYDQSRVDLLTRMTDEIRSVDSTAYVILEHLAVDEEEKVLAEYGMLLWGNMNEAYREAVAGDTESDFSRVLASERGLPDGSLIAYMESHDEERLMVIALNDGESAEGYDIQDLPTALDRVKMATAFYYPLPGPKMLWQFGELGYDIPIDFNGRVGNKPIPWGREDSLNYYGDADRQQLYTVTAAIINLVNDYTDAFEDGALTTTLNGQMREISVSHESLDATIIGNFGVTSGTIEPTFAQTGTWYDYLSGVEYEATETSPAITLAPGEFHIYLDQQVGEPVVIVTSLEDEAAETAVNLYPNPTAGQVTLDAGESGVSDLSVRIMNVTGQEYRRATVRPSAQGEWKIDVSGLPAGIYLLEAQTAGRRLTGQRFVIE